MWWYWDGAFTEEELNYIYNNITSESSTGGITGYDDSKIENTKIRSVKQQFITGNENQWIQNRFYWVAHKLTTGQPELFDVKFWPMYEHSEPAVLLTYDTKGDHYSWHEDGATFRPMSKLYSRKLTLVLLVSDTESFTGGNLEVLGGAIPLMRGRTVMFPSFAPHRVTPLKSGVRKSLVQWIYGPHWK